MRGLSGYKSTFKANMTNRNFTIILPVRNGGEYLKECVKSILAQTYKNFDVAILENESTDGSAKWLESLRDSRIKIYPSTSDLSIQDNWARALTIPRQEFITFIGHDDLLTPDFLVEMNQLIEDDLNASLYQTDFHIIDQSGKIINTSKIAKHETLDEMLRGFLTLQRQSFSGCVMRRNDYDKVGGFPNYSRLLWADIVLWLRLASISHAVAISKPCFLLRVHPNSTGVSSKGQAILDAMNSFIQFLKDFQQDHEELIPIIQENAPSYFLHHARLIYLLDLVDATKRNTRIDPKVLLSLQKAVDTIAPGCGNQIDNTRSLRLRKLLNNNFLLRSLYISYIRIFYGANHLPPS